MDLNLLKGIYVPILTPMTEEENVDYARLRKHVNFLIDNGIHGILAHGSNSEFYMFDEKNMKKLLKLLLMKLLVESL